MSTTPPNGTLSKFLIGALLSLVAVIYGLQASRISAAEVQIEELASERSRSLARISVLETHIEQTSHRLGRIEEKIDRIIERR